MESPMYEFTHDYVHENEITSRAFDSGYTKGVTDGSLKLTEILIKMTPEELLQWYNYTKLSAQILESRTVKGATNA